MDMRELHWAAGFLEGEGCFCNQRAQVLVSAVQVQRQPLERLLALFGGKIYACNPRRKNWQPYFKWNTQGSRGAGIAMTLFTLMSPRRQEQIAKALARWKSVPYNVNAVKTHCPSGHVYTPENTYLHARKTVISRICRACRNVARNRHRDLMQLTAQNEG
jgi:hypothetical protein